MDTTKDIYKAKMEAQLNAWRAQLNALKAKAAASSADTKVEILKRANKLTELELSAKQHIAEVERSAVDAWDKLSVGVEHAWNKLSGTVEALLSHDSSERPTKH